LRQALELAQSNETLLKRVKFDQLFKEFTSLLDVDADRWFMNDKDSEEQDRLEAENQQRMIQLETAKINAEIAKMEAEVALTNAKANAEVGRVQIDAEKLKLEQRKAITEEIEQTRDSNRIEKPK
jgi:hypothetical protein